MVEPTVVQERIAQAFPEGALVRIEDLTGTKDHYEVTVVASSFEGKSRVEQHQMVYRALGELMNGPVHALALKTFTPEAWQRSGG